MSETKQVEQLAPLKAEMMAVETVYWWVVRLDEMKVELLAKLLGMKRAAEMAEYWADWLVRYSAAQLVASMAFQMVEWSVVH